MKIVNFREFRAGGETFHKRYLIMLLYHGDEFVKLGDRLFHVTLVVDEYEFGGFRLAFEEIDREEGDAFLFDEVYGSDAFLEDAFIECVNKLKKEYL